MRTFSSLGRAGVELYVVEFFLKGLGNKRTSLTVLDKSPDSIGRAVDRARNFEANVSWVRETQKQRVYSVWRREINWGKAFCGDVGHMAGSCPRNAWSKNR